MSEEEFSFANLRLISSWVDQLLYCKNLTELNPNHQIGTQLNGNLRVISLFKSPKSWLICGLDTELPEIISHYLHLNLSFARTNNDFDGTLGWYNETHSSGPLRMIINDEIDYTANYVFVTENIWNPNLYQLSTALFDDYTINFFVKKQLIKTSISDYFKTFNWSTWLFIFSLIVFVSIVQTFIRNFNLEIRFNYNFLYILTKEYITMMLNQSSNLLKKLTPNHYLMYFIPILSVLIITLFQNIIYLNMIVPRKHWCQDLDCFAKSKIDFHAALDDPALIELKQKKEWQFKMILSRLTTIKPRSIVSKLIN